VKIDQKEKLLIFILAVALLLVFFILFLVPSMQADREEMLREIAELEEKIEEMKGEGDVINHYKLLNMKIGAFLKSYFRSTKQEEIIIIIDDLLKTTGIEAQALSFSEGANLEQPLLQKYPCVGVTFNFKATAQNYFNFLKTVGNYHKKILIEELALTVAEDNANFSGTIKLQFMQINSGTGEQGYLTKDIPMDKGKNNPFSANSTVNIVYNTDLAKILMDQIKGGNCDFTLTAKPTDSDLPAVFLGLEKDPRAESYVCALPAKKEKAKIEKVSIRLFQEDGKYYYQYNTESERYPVQGNKEIPFACGNDRIVLHIFSDSRKDSEDKNGVALSINNETGLPFIIEVKSDDPASPRIDFKELKGNVSVYNSQGALINAGVPETASGMETNPAA
jgi:hypothetical protein